MINMKDKEDRMFWRVFLSSSPRQTHWDGRPERRAVDGTNPVLGLEQGVVSKAVKLVRVGTQGNALISLRNQLLGH